MAMPPQSPSPHDFSAPGNQPPPYYPPAAPPTRRGTAKWWIGGSLTVILFGCLIGAVAVGSDRNGDRTRDATGTDSRATEQPAGDDTEQPAAQEEPDEPAGHGAGIWEIGTDIEAGTYVTTAPGDSVFDSCYWARLAGFSGEFNELIANGNINGGGRGRITLSDGDAGIEFKGDCQWLPADDDTDTPPGDEVGTGTWEVGSEIEPGTYTTTAPGDGVLDSCYWARLAGFSGEFDELIANGNIEGGAGGRIEISPDDSGIQFRGDCVWAKA